MPTMTVKRIEDQGDRIVIYADEPPSRWGPFYVIARAASASALALKCGDIIHYRRQEGAWNSGWYIEPEGDVNEH
jgi:hypothetical protein